MNEARPDAAHGSPRRLEDILADVMSEDRRTHPAIYNDDAAELSPAEIEAALRGPQTVAEPPPAKPAASFDHARAGHLSAEAIKQAAEIACKELEAVGRGQVDAALEAQCEIETATAEFRSRTAELAAKVLAHTERSRHIAATARGLRDELSKQGMS